MPKETYAKAVTVLGAVNAHWSGNCANYSENKEEKDEESEDHNADV